MANKWAIQNGNWSDGSTWNDGVVPTADDDVDLVGYIVAIPVNTTIVAKTITNTGGGYINNAGACIINADLYPNSGYLFNNAQITVNGNVTFSSTGYFERTSLNGQGGKYTINGNVTVESTCSRDGVLSMPYYSGDDTINGNIVCEANVTVFRGTTGVGTLFINGNVDIREGYFYISSTFAGQIVFNGDVRVKTKFSNATSVGGSLINNTVSFYGNMTYNYPGIPITALNYAFGENTIVRNNSTTGAIFANNRQFDYANPEPDEVAAGVVYGVNRELVGELQLPPEGTVLKDVTYGDKTGTLEVIALSGATATADNISVVNLTEQDVERVKNCATVSTVQKCFEEFKE